MVTSIPKIREWTVFLGNELTNWGGNRMWMIARGLSENGPIQIYTIHFRPLLTIKLWFLGVGIAYFQTDALLASRRVCGKGFASGRFSLLFIFFTRSGVSFFISSFDEQTSLPLSCKQLHLWLLYTIVTIREASSRVKLTWPLSADSQPWMVGKVQEVVVRLLAELQGSAILQKNPSGSAFHQDCSERLREDLENRQSNFSGSNETSNGCNIY